jgi:hypothetical protein
MGRKAVLRKRAEELANPCPTRLAASGIRCKRSEIRRGLVLSYRATVRSDVAHKERRELAASQRKDRDAGETNA